MLNTLVLPHYVSEATTVGIVGLGREGWSTYRWLRQFRPELNIWAVDDAPLSALDPAWTTVTQTDRLVQVVSTDEWLANPKAAEVAFKTPGLPPRHPVVTSMALADTVWSSNVQLFFELLPSWSAEVGQPLPTIGITGTKGKSTTTALIHHVLVSAGFSALLGGNIGKPALDLLSENLPTTQPTYLVLELSAHQLVTLPYSPTWAVIQAIVPEHLDYYSDFESYWQAKTAIASHQTPEDHVIFNPSHATAARLAALSPGQTHLFTLSDQPGTVASIHDGQVWQGTAPLMPVSDLPLTGEHNWENVLPAIVIATELHISPEKLVAGLRSFQGLPHRLQVVATHQGIKYFNDSLSTVPEAAEAAIAAMGTEPIVLLAGGFERHQDYHHLAQVILDHSVIGLVTFPTTGDRLWENLCEVATERGIKPPAHLATESMSEAVTWATTTLKTAGHQTGAVVLSPASPSFGLFKDYADRGDQFAKAAQSLA